MKVIDFWKPGRKPTISFELFPARSEKAAERLDRAIESLAALKPDFVSVTFGAGGSTREGSLNLLRKLKEEMGLEVLAYFAGYGLSPQEITAVLDDYHEAGIQNLLLVRGDPPHDTEFQPHAESFSYASELVAFIRPKYDFCLGVAGYPEGHIEATSLEKDIKYLKMKVDYGAEYIITNYCYDNRFYFDFVDRCLTAGIKIPILPGIMPVYSVKMMTSLAGLCGATITDELRSGIDALPEGDKDALEAYGVNFATQQCTQLIEAGVVGLHMYTMDRSKSTVGIINQLRDEGSI